MEQSIATLSHSASRLLLALLLYSDFNDQPKTRQMHICGIGKDITYRQARRELEDAGFIRLEREAGKRHSIVLVHCTFLSSTDGDGGLLDRVIYSNSIVGQSKNGHQKPDHENGSTLRGLGGSTPKVVPQEDYQYPDGSTLKGLPPLKVVPQEDYHPTLLERCGEVDAMDDSGDLAVRTSPAQQRRKAQIPLIQEAWAAFFPHDHALLPENARLFLSLNEESATEVVMELEDRLRTKPDLAAPGQSPLAYFKARFKNRRDERRSVAQTVHASSSSTVPYTTSSTWDGELMEPSEDWKAKAQRAQQVAASIWREER